MRRRIVLALGCAVVAAALSVSAAQTPQQRPIFRAGSVLVNVDAYPRRDGKIVTDLTKADFEVFEDGKPQAVETFEFVRVEPYTPIADRRDPTSIADANRQAADPRNRVFVIYLDIFHTTVFGAHHAREPIVQFLNRTIGPTDLFGVMTPELPPTALTFARRTTVLEDELLRNWDWGEAGRIVIPRNDVERRLWSCGGDGLVLAYREELTATNIEDLVRRLENLRDERKNVVLFTEGWRTPRGAPPGVGGDKRGGIPTIGVGPGGRIGIGANMSGDPDRAWCEGQKVRLAQTDYEFRFRELLNLARRANVAFYPVDLGGLRTYQLPASYAPRPGENVLLAAENYRSNIVDRLEVLQTLAINTDGDAIVNTNDLTGAVRQISDDLSAYYLLSYYSGNTAADGKYRRIEVKVKAPGVKVSARRGYLAPTPEIRKAEEAARSRPVTGPTPVDVELNRLARIRSDARLYSAAVASPAGLDVVVEIASQEVEGGRWAAGGEIEVTVQPRDASADAVSAKGRIEPGTRGARVAVPLTTASPSGWRVRSRLLGEPGTFEDDIEVATLPASLVGEPIVFRALPSPRSVPRPAAEYKFRRTERIHVEWPVAKTLDERSARLLSRRGDPLPVPVALTERADGDRITLAADLTLAPLVDGDYVIEIAVGAGSDRAQKLLAFRVVR